MSTSLDTNSSLATKSKTLTKYLPDSDFFIGNTGLNSSPSSYFGGNSYYGNTKTTGGKIAGGVSGALTGASAGATIGSIIPGIGTTIGAIIGGLIGAGGGAFL